jgi:predicted RNA-binding protein (virulence factor B family)
MRYQAGDMAVLTVLRETDIAYLLIDKENNEYFLHKRQAKTELFEGDQIEVFLFFDNQKRLTVTMNLPFVTLEKPALAEVVDVNYRLGVFFDIGIYKHLLLSRDDLPFRKDEWPRVGSKLFIILKRRSNQLVAKQLGRMQMGDYYHPTPLEIDSKVMAAANFFSEDGTTFISDVGHLIFVYKKHMRKNYHLGEVEEIKVTNMRNNNEYNGIVIKQRELQMSDDAVVIMDYLVQHDGTMSYTDKSPADVIERIFKMSKSAFKRAVGSLYKEQKIVLTKETITLKKD